MKTYAEQREWDRKKSRFGYLLAIPSGLYVGCIILQDLLSFLEAPIGFKKHPNTGNGWVVGLAVAAWIIGKNVIEYYEDK